MTDDELNRLFDALRQDNAVMRQESAAAHADTRHHFDVAVERMEKRFDLLAESVVHISDELQGTRTALEETIERTAAETQAMIKFSHKELDRRMTTLEVSQRTLESTVAGLQARLERLESSTH